MLQKFPRFLQLQSQRYYAAPAVAVKRPNTEKTKPAPYIQCRRKEFNLVLPGSAGDKFGSIPLASNGWLHNKSKNDFFIINPTMNEEERTEQMQDIASVINSKNLIISPELLKNLKTDMEISHFTAIQAEGIPKIYDSNHVLVAAETGCGKTLTYLLPIVQRILERKTSTEPDKDRKLNTPFVLILTPGRELATQIGDVARKICDSTGLNVKTILGGNTKQLMMNPEFSNVDILVATMGAISKLVTTGIYRMDQVTHLVLDEADTLLDDSFSEKLCYFLRRFPFHKNYIQDDKTVGTQLVLASATMPTNISELLQNVIDVDTLHQVVSPNLHRLMPHVQQKFLRTNKADRPGLLLNLVKTDLAKKRPLIVFSNKSASSDFISMFLNKSGVNCINLNGDMLWKIRVGRFQQFQNAECNVLSTTDIGSRGLDTTRARHVINFDFPLHVADYIHRSGRIGRVGSMQKCLVTNLISSRREIDVVQRIEHTARTGGILPNVNANITNIIKTRIIQDCKAAGIANEEVF